MYYYCRNMDGRIFVASRPVRGFGGRITRDEAYDLLYTNEVNCINGTYDEDETWNEATRLFDEVVARSINEQRS